MINEMYLLGEVDDQLDLKERESQHHMQLSLLLNKLLEKQKHFIHLKQ
jgi:hypothetical protein